MWCLILWSVAVQVHSEIVSVPKTTRNAPGRLRLYEALPPNRRALRQPSGPHQPAPVQYPAPRLPLVPLGAAGPLAKEAEGSAPDTGNGTPSQATVPRFDDFAFVVVTGKERQRPYVPALQATWLRHFDQYLIASDVADPTLGTVLLPRRAPPSSQNGVAETAQQRFVDGFMEVCQRWGNMSAYGIVDDDVFVQPRQLRRVLDQLATEIPNGKFVAGFSRGHDPFGGLLVLSKELGHFLCDSDHHYLRKCMDHMLLLDRLGAYPYKRRPKQVYAQDHVWAFCSQYYGGVGVDVPSIWYYLAGVSDRFGKRTLSPPPSLSTFFNETKHRHIEIAAVHYVSPKQIRRLASFLG